MSSLRVLRHRDLALMLGGRLLSLIGSQMQAVAISWQLWKLTRNPLALGGLGLARLMPLLLVALVGGVVADAFDRRRVIGITTVVGLLTSAALAAATLAHAASPPLLYAAAAIGGALSAVENPARQALIPNLVPAEELGPALSLGATSYYLAASLGPALGGVVLAAWGPGTVYAVDAISFTTVLVSVAALRFRPGPTASVSLGLGAVREGLAFLRAAPLVWSTMLLDFFATLFAGCTQLLPVFAERLFAVGPFGLGLLVAAPSVGAAAATFWVSVRPVPRAVGATILSSVAVYGASIAAFGATTSFWLGLVLLACSGGADALSAVLRQVVRQTHTPDALRGRMTSLNMIFFAGGPHLGEVEAGVVARLAGVRASVVSGGLACIVLAIVAALSSPRLRRHRE